MRRILTSVISLLIALIVLAPVSHAETDDLSVRIDSISPTVLADDSTITLTGTATNEGEETWTAAHAYMVIPRWPYTSRMQVHDVLTSDYAYVGERIVDTDRFATIGALAPGESKQFTIRVPSEELGLTSADGIYPVGVHLVATDPQGMRDPQSQARDLTLLPRMSADSPRVPTGLVWPFIDTSDPAQADSEELAQSVIDGQLRRYLDAASQTPAAARTLLIDPAILDSIETLTSDSAEVEFSKDDISAISAWNTDLVELSRTSDTWIIDYARPDYFGFIASPQAEGFSAAVAGSTQDAAERHELTGQRIIWPAANDTSEAFLNHLARLEPDRVVVSSDHLPDWEATDGSVFNFVNDDSKVPLLAFTPLQFSQVAESSSLFVQHTLTKAALSSLERQTDPSARSDAIAVMNPRWDPDMTLLAPLLDRIGQSDSLLRPTTLSSLPDGNAPNVAVRSSTSTKAFGQERLELSAQLLRLTDLTTDISLAPWSVDGPQNALARAVSMQWRGENAAAQRATAASIAEQNEFLNQITLEAPATITLSGQHGAFPLTITNNSPAPVRVSLDVDADVQDITFDDVPAFRIEPGASHTMTVSANMGRQVAATVTAQLSSPSGTSFGESRAFVLRSSNVGQIVWIAMGFAVLLVIAAAVRRFAKRRHRAIEDSTDG